MAVGSGTAVAVAVGTAVAVAVGTPGTRVAVAVGANVAVGTAVAVAVGTAVAVGGEVGVAFSPAHARPTPSIAMVSIVRIDLPVNDNRSFTLHLHVYNRVAYHIL